MSGRRRSRSDRRDRTGRADRAKVVKRELYKTELCRHYVLGEKCPYRDKCQFAHGSGEIQDVVRHPKYKTEPCKSFHTTGFCSYGSRCHFIHGGSDESGSVAPTGSRTDVVGHSWCSTASGCGGTALNDEELTKEPLELKVERRGNDEGLQRNSAERTVQMDGVQFQMLQKKLQDVDQCERRVSQERLISGVPCFTSLVCKSGDPEWCRQYEDTAKKPCSRSSGVSLLQEIQNPDGRDTSRHPKVGAPKQLNADQVCEACNEFIRQTTTTDCLWQLQASSGGRQFWNHETPASFRQVLPTEWVDAPHPSPQTQARRFLDRCSICEYQDRAVESRESSKQDPSSSKAWNDLERDEPMPGQFSRSRLLTPVDPGNWSGGRFADDNDYCCWIQEQIDELTERFQGTSGYFKVGENSGTTSSYSKADCENWFNQSHDLAYSDLRLQKQNPRQESKESGDRYQTPNDLNQLQSLRKKLLMRREETASCLENLAIPDFSPNAETKLWNRSHLEKNSGLVSKAEIRHEIEANLFTRGLRETRVLNPDPCSTPDLMTTRGESKVSGSEDLSSNLPVGRSRERVALNGLLLSNYVLDRLNQNWDDDEKSKAFDCPALDAKDKENLNKNLNRASSNFVQMLLQKKYILIP